MLNDAVITIDEARALVSDQALWPRVRDFLWNFAPQVHGSWLEGLGRGTADAGRDGEPAAPQVARLMSSPRARRFVLSSLGVAPCFHLFPKDDWSRLLLLDGSTLESLAKWLGALACVDSLRRVTDGAAVRGLKAALPGVYPEVFGYTMYFAGMDLGAGDAKGSGGDGAPLSGNEVASAGVKILFAMLGGVPGPLVSRLRFKLPKSLCGLCGETGSRPAPSFIAKVLKLKFPEAHKLCC